MVLFGVSHPLGSRSFVLVSVRKHLLALLVFVSVRLSNVCSFVRPSLVYFFIRLVIHQSLCFSYHQMQGVKE